MTTFIIESSGISGSITKLADGSSYLIAGQGITITSQSNGSVVVVATNPQADDESGLYGTGNDGSVALDGTNTYSCMTRSGNQYSLTRDIYPSSLSIISGSIFKTKGFRIFVDGSCNIVSGSIDNSAADDVGTSAGSVAGSPPGGFNTAGHSGDLGGEGGVGSGGTYVGGTITGNGSQSLPFVLTMFTLDPSSPGVIPTRPGASGGAGSLGAHGGGAGGFIILAAKTITIGSGGSIQANGGNGISDGSSAGGGGGGGAIASFHKRP